jgi:hypothetical protein
VHSCPHAQRRGARPASAWRRYLTSVARPGQDRPSVSGWMIITRYDRRTSLLAYGLAALATWAVLGLSIYLHPGLDQDAVQD